MKTLYLDCSMGAAGDMLTAALYELIDDKAEFLNQINNIGLHNIKVNAKKVLKCSITGTYFDVCIDGEHEHSHDHHHHNEHTNNHSHSHSHNSLKDIEHIINGHLNISDKIKNDVISVYKLIAQAESHIHGVDMTDIHFHEVGTIDAIIDITAVCILMDKLKPNKVICSPINVGSGHVHCAHGILPVPAPATAYILQNIPIYSGDVSAELCTPTGAALLKYFVTEFNKMPVMNVQKIGYGCGKKDFHIANCVRAMLGETNQTDNVLELSFNIDDMTAENIAFATERLFDIGALDVFTGTIGMKKSRQATLISVLCYENIKNEISMQNIIELGFDDEFIENIVFYNNDISTLRINNHKLFSFVKKKMSIQSFIEDEMEKYRSISISDFVNNVNEEYSIGLTYDVVKGYVYGLSNIYYSPILDKLYIDKEDFYKEIYDE